MIRQNKKTGVFQVTSLEILGRVGTQFFFLFLFFFFLKKKMHFERHFAFQNALNLNNFFLENLTKI